MDIDRCINHSQKNMFYSLEDLLNSLKENKKNNNILFSPGYPSGKDFKNFVERGECFNQLVKAYL